MVSVDKTLGPRIVLSFLICMLLFSTQVWGKQMPAFQSNIWIVKPVRCFATGPGGSNNCLVLINNNRIW